MIRLQELELVFGQTDTHTQREGGREGGKDGQHCEKESTRVFDFGIEVRTAGIEVRDHSSQNGLVLQYHLFVVIYNFNTKIGSLNHIVGSS